jgi:hypothetical protein
MVQPWSELFSCYLEGAERRTAVLYCECLLTYQRFNNLLSSIAMVNIKVDNCNLLNLVSVHA